MQGEVQKNLSSLIQKYTEEAKKEDTMVEANIPTKPYLGGTRVVYPIGRSNALPPGLRLGGDGRIFGSKDKNRKRR